MFGTVSVKTTDTAVTITMPSGMKLIANMWQINSICGMNVHHLIPGTISQSNILGLMGSPDGEKWNDWTAANGSPISVPIDDDVRDDEGDDYCKTNWRVDSAAQSIFTYETGLSHASIKACTNVSWDGTANRKVFLKDHMAGKRLCSRE